MIRLDVRPEVWPLAGEFRISRDAKTETRVVVVEIADSAGGARGWGECVPYPRYGESTASVVAQIEEVRAELEDGLDRAALQTRMPAGAARNAVDCALWDLEAKRSGRRAWELAGLPAPEGLVSAFTLGLDRPEAMARQAAGLKDLPVLKLKLDGGDDIDRVRAIREVAPGPRLIVDANEAWRPDQVEALSVALAELDVSLIEQPLAQGGDDALAGIDHPVPICADESCHTVADLDLLAGRYDVVNVKLDKTGGLTGALALGRAAREAGLDVMVGCMIGTSLAMAPAMVAAIGAGWVDLDGPLLMARDREPPIETRASLMSPPQVELWG